MAIERKINKSAEKKSKSTPEKLEQGKRTISRKPRIKSSLEETKKSRPVVRFSTKKLGNPEIESSDKKEKQVPVWIVIIFLFSLVFFFFALYKAFIYGQGYSNDVKIIDLPLLYDEQTLDSSSESGVQNSGNQQEIGSSDSSDRMTSDIKLIQDFYTYLTNNQIDEMNGLVDRPLKNSVVWGNHWNKKNIQIFTKHLSDMVELQDIFLIPNSTNPEKHTRQYSYALKYIIQPGQSFQENWELTLVDRGEKTLISAIMCKTEGCSHSPFFWPQNYGLK